MVLRRYDGRLTFALCAFAVIATCLVLVHSALFLRRPDVLSVGVVADLLVTLPLLYWLCVVRTKKASPITLLPAFLGCMTLTKLIVPADARLFLQPLLLASGPLEAFSLGWLIYRIRQRVKQGMPVEDGPSFDRLERFQQRARAVIGDNPLVDLVFSEIAVAYYGIGGWFMRPATPSGASISTCYRRSGWGGLLGGFLFLMLMEGSVVHLLLSQWKPLAAWLWNAGDLYLVLWLLADYQAMRLRPLLLTGDALYVSLGLRWRAFVPRSQIAGVTSFSQAKSAAQGADYLRIAPMSTPKILVTLREPVEFHGLFGKKKSVQRLGILPDDPAFVRCLEEVAAENSTRAETGTSE